MFVVTSNFSILSVLGADYTVPSPQEVTFSSGGSFGTTACATYGIIDDDNLEFDHAFTVSVDSVTPSGTTIVAPSSTTVTIIDNEGMHCTMVTFLYTLLLAGHCLRFDESSLFILSSSMTAVISDIQGIHCVNNCKVLLSTDTQLASFGNPFMCMQFKEVCMQYRTVRCRNRAGGKLRICHCCCHTVSGGALLLAAKQLTNCTACGKTLVVNFQSFGRDNFVLSLHYHCFQLPCHFTLSAV